MEQTQPKELNFNIEVIEETQLEEQNFNTVITL
jgi:hypothetical protein